jgi:hypothetical protein
MLQMKLLKYGETKPTMLSILEKNAWYISQCGFMVRVLLFINLQIEKLKHVQSTILNKLFFSILLLIINVPYFV